jgi:uncharacterized secreted repeat protein (TIGR03808 family)
MTINRRKLLAWPVGGVAVAAASTAALSGDKSSIASGSIIPKLVSGSPADQSRALQQAIDDAAAQGCAVTLPPGRFIVSDIRLRAATRLIGEHGTTTLAFGGGEAFITGDRCDDAVIGGITFDGQFQALSEGRGNGLISISSSKNFLVNRVVIENCAHEGLSLDAVSGAVTASLFRHCTEAAIKSLDAKGLSIDGNVVQDCSNNGILIWRSEVGSDGTQVSANRISRIGNARGGTGQYGNGINVFRASDVQVMSNTISECSYSAIRGNAASNILMQGNTCRRIGEVAIYAEFGFEGALIANNIVDGAASGISVTNFNEGGRLAVISGNLLRNLKRREFEPEDKRGEGIGVEADAAVIGNTIENAATSGIQIGWGRYMRDVAVTGNVVRKSKVGVSVTASIDAGTCLIANNLISGSANGAVRTMHLGVLVGPDLAKGDAAPAHISVTGNVSA